MRLRVLVALAAFALSTLDGPAARAASQHLIICGAGGEETYQQRFLGWGIRLRAALESLGHPADRITLMTDNAQGGENAGVLPAKSLESIEEALGKLSQTISPDDTFFLYLIGHGSYLKDDSKLNITGEDLTAKEVDRMLEAAHAENIVIINMASTSAGWVNELSAPNRIICSATKSIDESNATEFTEHFLGALEQGSADRNHDDRISVLEACQQAAALTASWYTREGFIATEHAILDDNGDGLGSRLPIVPVAEDEFAVHTTEGAMPVFDGELAKKVYLRDYDFAPTVPRELIDQYLAAIDEIETFKAKKESMDETAYYAELETLLVRAATVNSQIRTPSDTGSAPESISSPAGVSPSERDDPTTATLEFN